MRNALLSLREYLRSRLWVLPAVGIVVVFLASRVTFAFDDKIDSEATSWYLFPGGAESARNLLSTIATATLTLTSVVFSVTLLVLQLASTQLSPRVMRTFLRDHVTQLTLATFVSIFVLSLLVLREVETGNVPSLSIWFCLILTLAGILLFIIYIDHMAQSIRPGAIMQKLGSETVGEIGRLYPDKLSNTSTQPADSALFDERSIVVRHEGSGGILTFVDAERLSASLEEQDVVVTLLPFIGDYVPPGGKLFSISGKDANLLEPGPLHTALGIARERTMFQDVRFGLRQLVDIGEKALSPGINDPTTAVQTLDKIHEILFTLATRDLPSRKVIRGKGLATLIISQPSWEDYVGLGLNELRRYGEGSFQVTSRIRSLLTDLLEAAPASRADALVTQWSLLEAALQRAFPEEEQAIVQNRAQPD